MCVFAMVLFTLASCQKEIITTSEIIPVEGQNLSLVENQENDQPDLTEYQESLVDLWFVINQRVADNGNLVKAYTENKTDEELQEAFLQDIGYADKSVSDFKEVFNYSLDKYKASLEAQGLMLDGDDFPTKVFKQDILANITLNRSCVGECDADYIQDGLICLVMGAGSFPVGLACVAANAYEYYHCLDSCGYYD